MGQLAGLILRYGVVMGKAMWEASKKGIALFKKSKEIPKIKLKPKPKMSDADYQKKFKAHNKESTRRVKVKESVQSYRKEVDKDTKWSPSRGISPNDPGVHNTPETLRKHLMNTPAAATALVGTGASLVHKNKSKKGK